MLADCFKEGLRPAYRCELLPLRRRKPKATVIVVSGTMVLALLSFIDPHPINGEGFRGRDAIRCSNARVTMEVR